MRVPPITTSKSTKNPSAFFMDKKVNGLYFLNSAINLNLVLTLFENNNTTYQIIRTKYDSARSFDVDKLPGILRTHINQYTSNDKTSYAPIPLVLEHNNSRSEHNCNPYPDHRIDCTKTTYKT